MKEKIKKLLKIGIGISVVYVGFNFFFGIKTTYDDCFEEMYEAVKQVEHIHDYSNMSDKDKKLTLGLKMAIQGFNEKQKIHDENGKRFVYLLLKHEDMTAEYWNDLDLKYVEVALCSVEKQTWRYSKNFEDFVRIVRDYKIEYEGK